MIEIWDLAIADNGDLIISGHQDLLGRSGTDLLEQRIRLRLMIHRGSWALDNQKTLGSNLYRLVGMTPTDAAQAAPALVREALRSMSEIVVDDVHVAATDTDITLVIFYHTAEVSQGLVSSGEEQQLTISLPVAATGSGSGE